MSKNLIYNLNTNSNNKLLEFTCTDYSELYYYYY